MNADGPREYRFGRHRLDVATCQLFTDGSAVALAPKALDLLRVLLEARGAVVSKDDLMARVWPDTIVEETNLTQTVFVLRKALQPNPAFPDVIATVARRGYRIAIPVEQQASPPGVHSDEPVVDRRPAGRTKIVVAGTVLAALIAASSILSALVAGIPAGWYLARWRAATPSAPTVRFSISVPTGWIPGSIALSSDGSRIVFVATSPEGTDRLWLRRLDALDAELVPGSDGAMYPFWSDDGQRIGFFASRGLQVIRPGEAGPRVVTDTTTGVGGAWLRDGRILFCPEPLGGIWIVNEDGTGRKPILQPPQARGSMRWPVALPDGRHFLYFSWHVPGASDGIWVGSLDGAPPVFLVESHGNAEYVGGYLLRLWNGDVVAQRFDAGRRRLEGEPITLVSRVGYNRGGLKGAFAASAAGVLTYREDQLRSELAWLTRDGRPAGAGTFEGSYMDPAAAPDGRHLAALELNGPRHVIWVFDPERGTRERISANGDEFEPLWSADGKRIVFTTWDGTFEKTFGSAEPARQIAPGGNRVLAGWAPGDNVRLYAGGNPRTGMDIWTERRGSNERTPIIAGPANEREPQFSPDGKWLAYASDETGRKEIYVQQMGGARSRLLVSTAGGEEPRWRGDGREIYFATAGALWSVAFTAEPEPRAEAPVRLFAVDLVGMTLFRSRYQVAPDGRRFLVCRALPSAAASSMVVLTNWDQTLRSR